MTKLGLFGATGLVVFGVFAACSGDEKAKKAQDNEAGAAGVPTNAGTGAEPGSGGSGTEPNPSEAGQGGQPVAEGGSGGSGGVPSAPGGAGGMSSVEGGAGGAPSYDCPADPGTFEYACALVASNPNQQLDNWSPGFDPATNTFTFDVSSLPFPIASGTISYIYTTNDAEACGSGEIMPGDGQVSINIGSNQELLTVIVTDFHFVDVCGQHHDYDPIGVACWTLAGSSEGSFTMVCEGSGSGQCPATCEIPAI